MPEHAVTTLAELPPATSAAFAVGGTHIAVFHSSDGRLHATAAYCTHAGGAMAAGHIQDEVLLCPLHLMAFDLTTGNSLHGQPPLQVYPVRADEHGNVLIELAAPAADPGGHSGLDGQTPQP